jgi:hypothetical protein
LSVARRASFVGERFLFFEFVVTKVRAAFPDGNLYQRCSGALRRFRTAISAATVFAVLCDRGLPTILAE